MLELTNSSDRRPDRQYAIRILEQSSSHGEHGGDPSDLSHFLLESTQQAVLRVVRGTEQIRLAEGEHWN